MFAYIKGKLTYIQEGTIIVDVTGIGYEIFCPDPFVFQQQMGKEVFVYTYHHVREDIQALYGFKTEDEKFLFEQLISVSGIGPKSAIAILGTVNVPDFIRAVEREDEKYLTQFPGVGKKTARQIMLDLKGKLVNVASFKQSNGVSVEQSTGQEQYIEAEEALKALGYTDREILNVMPQLRHEQIKKTDDIVRKALALLMKK